MEDKTKTLTLTRRESAAIKGVLIFLIVLGHNHVMAPVNGSLFQWLYHWHVQCFFLLPFFYAPSPVRRDARSYVATLVVRHWWPYLLTAVAVWVSQSVRRGGIPLSWSTLWAVVNGSPALLDANIGAVFLWFMPSYCCLSLIRLAEERWRQIGWLCLVVGLVLWFVDWRVWFKVQTTVPFGLPVALRLYALGYLCRLVLNMSRWIVYVLAVVFAALSVAFFVWGVAPPHCSMVWPVSALCLLLSLRRLITVAPVEYMGRQSLVFYLLHLFIYNVVAMWLAPTPVNGVLNFVLTLGASLLIAAVLDRLPPLRRLFLPRSASDLLFWQHRVAGGKQKVGESNSQAVVTQGDDEIGKAPRQ